MELASYMKTREMRAVVEWAPREFNKEEALWANGITDSNNPTRRMHVSAQSLPWHNLPGALQAEREAERAFQEMKERRGLPNVGSRRNGKWRRDLR